MVLTNSDGRAIPRPFFMEIHRRNKTVHLDTGYYQAKIYFHNSTYKAEIFSYSYHSIWSHSSLDYRKLFYKVKSKLRSLTNINKERFHKNAKNRIQTYSNLDLEEYWGHFNYSPRNPFIKNIPREIFIQYVHDEMVKRNMNIFL